MQPVTSLIITPVGRSIGTALFVIGVSLFGAQPAAAAIIGVSGSTLGCFGTGCDDFVNPSTSTSDFGLTFTGTAFAEVTDPSGSAADINLGTITRTNEQIRNTEGVQFTLQVTFALPAGITGGSPGMFTATITGATPGANGPASIIFNEDWLELEYSNAFGSGSFEFNVTDDPTVNPNGTAIILGGIRNATFTPLPEQEDEDPPSGAPEPSVLILLGTAAAAFARRSRGVSP